MRHIGPDDPCELWPEEEAEIEAEFAEQELNRLNDEEGHLIPGELNYPAAFTGWTRERRGPWKAVVPAATEAEAWHLLLERPGYEKAVTQGDRHPNDGRQKGKARR